MKKPFLLLMAMTATPLNGATDNASQPPVAKKVPKIDVVHGDRRQDDYFWLRDKKNPDVAAYLEAENAFTDAVMRPTEALQETLYREMKGRIQETDINVPYRRRGYWYYSRTEEGKQYPIYCRKKGSLDSTEEVTLDLNVLAEGQKFMALGTYRVSDDGALLAYSTDNTGFREYTLRIKDLRTGELLPERVEKTGPVAWAADNRTLFYVVEEESSKRQYRLYRHRLGTQAHDLVYEEKDQAFNVEVGRTRSMKYVVLAAGSHTTSEARYLPADQPQADWKPIAPRIQDQEYEVEHHGDSFYMRVNDTGRNFRLVKAPVARPGREAWQEVVPQRPDVMLEGVDFFRDHYVLFERERGLPRFRVTDLRSGASHEIAFPEPTYSAAPGTNAEFETRTYRYNYQSLVTPSSVFDYDFSTRESKLMKETPVLGGYDRAQYVSERLLATAPDRVAVPISIVYRKGLQKDGRAPLLLSGYGSYGFPFPVEFSSNRLSLLDRGVTVALAHVRGGGELGKAWHDDGRMMKKNNTFSDFIAGAEFLIAEKYTSPGGLVIQGGSAGGLLMGAVANMRPDLWKAVISQVPFVDVVNTMLDQSLPLTVGEFEEWGNPSRKDEYDYMKAYCPYTNLAPKPYPAILVKTSFNDSQVMYWEPAKYVARLRTLKTDDHPLLLKTNMAAGHGGASGRYDRLREIAFDYAFVLTSAGMAG